MQTSRRPFSNAPEEGTNFICWSCSDVDKTDMIDDALVANPWTSEPEKMRIVGRDHILKLLNQEYFESVFDIRRKCSITGKPQELGKNSSILFAIKNAAIHPITTS